MLQRLIGRSWKQFWIILIVVLTPAGIAAQDLEAKLAQKADFLPAGGTVREQLVQVAKHYRIPMGIEWALQSDEKQVKIAPGEAPTVMQLLRSILRAAPDYSMTVKKRVVHVSQNRYAVDSRNFLNLRIEEFSLTKANVLDATAELRFKIRATLHPELFVGGTNGGYGGGFPEGSGLDLENISFSRKNLTVRDILDQIIISNGNALWFVSIAPPAMMKNEPYYAQFEANEEGKFLWKIISFTSTSQ